MCHYKMHTEIVNTIFRIYVNIIEKYLSHVKNVTLQKKVGDLTQSVEFQQSIPLLSFSSVLALRWRGKYLRH